MNYWVAWYDGIGHACVFHDKLEAMKRYLRAVWSGGIDVMLWDSTGTIWNNTRPVVITEELPF